MNSFQKLDSTLLTNDLKSKFQDFLYVGFLTLPIPPPPLPPSHSDATGCLPWLDRQKLSSVAYISFGTVAAVSPNEAEALEASGVPFLWSLRDNLKQLLPNGFVQRTSASMQGKIVAWAPQSQVLAHSAVGVYRGGVFTKNGMLKSLELVMGEHEGGRRMREKIRELKEIVVKAAGPYGMASKNFKTLVELISK
uniref:Uncharacterized protein n=1 Tax=Fagus sylvatica TaxID=28930 RepID=A0A2N9H1W3_FAGSY